MHGVHQNSEDIITDARELISQLADTLDSTGLLPVLRDESTQKNLETPEDTTSDDPENSPAAAQPLATREESADEDEPVAAGSSANENE